MAYDWDFDVLWQYRKAFLTGMTLTIFLSLTAIVLGTVIGIFWGLLLSTRHRALLETRAFAFVLNDIVRALPLLVFLLLLNYYTPTFFGIHTTFGISLLALSVNLGAFIADVFRGAVAGVQRPLRDAGFAVGMTETQVMRRIVVPEAIRSIVPTLGLLYIDIFKMSSLASVIAFPEMTHVAGRVSSAEFRPLEVFALIAVAYIAIVVPLSHVQRRLEKSRWFIRRS